MGAQVIVISGLNTTGSFTFDKPQQSNTYPVLLNPIQSKGNPPLKAFIPVSIAKTASGFVVTIGAAPGPGNSVTFELGLTFNA
jgi:hypothetical protein